MTSTSSGASAPAMVELASGENGCTPRFTFRNGMSYRFGFDRDCIGAPQRFTARVHFRFDPPHAEPVIDIAPNGRYTPPLVARPAR